uniref:MAGE family member D4 n=1 Tax=Myotis myotis TaxID=51298 RepID=A0A7J7YFI8_MYOMY|nr:MAGE family member D4 [Myotis myotis]
MAEGSSPMESECCNVEDMEDGLEEVREYEMFDGNEYEEFGAFGGYGTFTSFDIHLLRAFGSLGTSLRVLAVRPEVDATQPKKAFLGQNDGFDFTQPAGVSGIAFPRPKRPAPAPEPTPEGPSAQAASAGEGAATRPKTAKSGKALAKTRWVEPQNVVAAAAAKAKMATSAPEPEGAAATAQNNRDEPWARMGGKRTKKSKHLDDEYESSEEEREPPVVPPTWRASQPPLTVRAQMAPRAQMGPRPPMAVRPQVPSRHILCLPPRNVALLQDRANKLVKYLMIKDYKKIPIKRSDMMKDVIREYDEHFPEIIERATYTLEKKFGIHLKEIDKEEHLYILTCTRDSSARLLGKTKDTPRLSLLLVILGVIFMNGNRVSEAVLWEALRKMGLRPGVRHPFLGDLKKLITNDFVRQKYLEYKKVPNSSPPEYEFFWGLRARYETSKMRVLRFIAQYQNRDPRDWKAHFLEAVDDAFKTMDADMAEEHARAQMRARMNIGDEALIGRWSWDDVQVELLTWDEDGDFGDAWARIPFAFWARYHQYILNSNRANRRTTWRAGVSSGNIGAANASLIDGPSTSSTIRSRNAARTTANFFSWIQQR